MKTLHRRFTSHPFSLDVCALQKRCLYSQLPRLNPFYCTNTAWDPQFLCTLNDLKDISPVSGPAKSRFYWHCSFNQASWQTFVPQGRSCSLGWSQEWDHAGSGGSVVMKEGTGGFGSWACLFVCLGVQGEDFCVMLGNKFGLILKYQFPGNCHQSN